MDRDYKKELQNFKAVWERVSCKNGKKLSVSLMPRREQKSRATRFGPQPRWRDRYDRS